ncbi:MAG: LysM peptidoglycan-binding domain-containing protein [Nocardioidaceae bacterium]|nr:LysM peptidoglycan-binding domain-containing protein [Nocardioidaceae bacterium]
MSTLSISPAFAPARARARRSTVRLTRRGRIVVLAVFLLAAFAVMIAAGGWATATRDAGTPEQVRIIEVQPGDTLYDIAGKLPGSGDVRSKVHRLQQLNSLPSSGLQVGQKLAVPVG